MDRHINAPLDAQTARELRAGDYVYITGIIYTARDAAHLRMDKALNRGEQLPVSLMNELRTEGPFIQTSTEDIPLV